MSPRTLLPLEDIKTVFNEEIEAAGGTVSDTFEDGSRLLVRSILPGVGEVAPRDQHKPGVALRATEQDISVYPYIFRLVCSNGAILAHVLDAQHIWLADIPTLAEQEITLRSKVQACCAEDWFVDATLQMRRAQQTPEELMISLLPHFAHMPRLTAQRLMDSIMREWMRNADHSRYGLMNAVTAVARDTSDPETKWQLEIIGGQIGIRGRSLAPFHERHAELTKELGQV